LIKKRIKNKVVSVLKVNYYEKVEADLQ